MAVTDDKPTFIVRRWWVNSAVTPADERVSRLSAAIELARGLAMKQDTRSVMVTDDQSMRWAEFNLLWSIPEEYR